MRFLIYMLTIDVNNNFSFWQLPSTAPTLLVQPRRHCHSQSQHCGSGKCSDSGCPSEVRGWNVMEAAQVRLHTRDSATVLVTAAATSTCESGVKDAALPSASHTQGPDEQQPVRETTPVVPRVEVRTLVPKTEAPTAAATAHTSIADDDAVSVTAVPSQDPPACDSGTTSSSAAFAAAINAQHSSAYVRVVPHTLCLTPREADSYVPRDSPGQSLATRLMARRQARVARLQQKHPSGGHLQHGQPHGQGTGSSTLDRTAVGVSPRTLRARGGTKSGAVTRTAQPVTPRGGSNTTIVAAAAVHDQESTKIDTTLPN